MAFAYLTNLSLISSIFILFDRYIDISNVYFIVKVKLRAALSIFCLLNHFFHTKFLCQLSTFNLNKLKKENQSENIKFTLQYTEFKFF